MPIIFGGQGLFKKNASSLAGMPNHLKYLYMLWAGSIFPHKRSNVSHLLTFSNSAWYFNLGVEYTFPRSSVWISFAAGLNFLIAFIANTMAFAWLIIILAKLELFE